MILISSESINRVNYYQILIGSNGLNKVLARVLCKAVPAFKVIGIVRWLDKLIKKLKKG
ncbi:hypothetical protein [Candidatus Hodgkinia cicadicola]|uniref:hypothetical protein n=1 Tax=Candidatus Hodgkinia cicadicola TaxID=573658 RepID=UPI00241573EF